MNLAHLTMKLKPENFQAQWKSPVVSPPVPAQPQPTTNKPKVEEVEEEVVHEPIDMGEVVVDLTDNNNDNQDIWGAGCRTKKG